MTISKEFACKIPNSGPVSMAERIAEMPQLGLWRSLMRDATIKIQDDSLSLICVDIYGKDQTVSIIPISQVGIVNTRAFSIRSQLGVALGKSIGIGIGIGILINIIMILKVGGLSRFLNAYPERVFTTVLFGLIGGIVIGFLFSFLPNAFRAKASFTEFVLSTPYNHVFVFAVERDHELLVIDALTSFGLKVEETSTRKRS